jgi:hypothetical protein
LLRGHTLAHSVSDKRQGFRATLIGGKVLSAFHITYLCPSAKVLALRFNELLLDNLFMVYKAFIRSAVAILLTVNGVANGAITITSPANNAKLAAGPDYATDVLGDPWDMSNPEDIGIYPDERNGWATFGFPGNGTLGGKTATVGANPPYVDTHATFLYRGFYDIINPDRTGRRFPIDTSIYKKLTFKMYSGVARELPQVYWHHTSIGDPTQRPGVVFTTEETI